MIAQLSQHKLTPFLLRIIPIYGEIVLLRIKVNSGAAIARVDRTVD